MTQFWQADRLLTDRPYLLLRNQAKRELFHYFDKNAYIEVETPALQISPGMEPHLAVFATRLMPAGAGFTHDGYPYYLHTSPEFAMKKLLAGGMDRIYQLCHVFRNGEGSYTHQPEFSMLEFYQATNIGAEDKVIKDVQADLMGLIRYLSSLSTNNKLQHRGLICDANLDWRILTVEQAFSTYAGFSLDEVIGENPDKPNVTRIKEQAERLKIRVLETDHFDDVFFAIFAEKIEPHLGHPEPCLLIDYPISMAALARPKINNPRLCERFELYIAGLELANGFGELNNPIIQRQRFEKDQALKQQLYGQSLPIDEDFLKAIAIMPPACGIALGFDRLVMLLTHVDDIKQTLWSYI